MGDGPPAPKGGRRLGQGRQASRMWRRGREAGPGGGLVPTFISLRSPQGPRNISVCFASNSCLTTAFLKAKRGKKKKKQESLKFRLWLLLLSIVLVKAHLSEAVLCRLSRHTARHPWLLRCPTITFTADERLSLSSSPSPCFFSLYTNTNLLNQNLYKKIPTVT